MGGQYTAIAMHEGELGVWHLALVGFAAQLPHPYDHMEHTARRARMTEA